MERKSYRELNLNFCPRIFSCFVKETWPLLSWVKAMHIPLFLATRERSVLLKCEQKQAIVSLLNGEDVLAVLSTGLGKSMICTVFAIAESEKLEDSPVSVLVICPLKGIISDQIVQLEGLCSAAEFTPESSKKIIEDPPIFIYCSAEQAPEER